MVRLLGKAHGHGLFQLARADDDRPVVADRETKSVSSEGTYDTDLTDRKLMEGLLARQATHVGERLRKHGLSGRTVTIKVRLHDFTTLSRSSTLASPTDSGPAIARVAKALLADLDTSGGVRLLGVGVSGLADWIQEDLFGETEPEEPDVELPAPRAVAARICPRHGRRAHRDGTRLGVGIGQGRGDRAFRDGRDGTGPGAVLLRRRSGAGAGRTTRRGLRTAKWERGSRRYERQEPLSLTGSVTSDRSRPSPTSEVPVTGPPQQASSPCEFCVSVRSPAPQAVLVERVLCGRRPAAQGVRRNIPLVPQASPQKTSGAPQKRTGSPHRCGSPCG